MHFFRERGQRLAESRSKPFTYREIVVHSSHLSYLVGVFHPKPQKEIITIIALARF